MSGEELRLRDEVDMAELCERKNLGRHACRQGVGADAPTGMRRKIQTDDSSTSLLRREAKAVGSFSGQDKQSHATRLRNHST